MNLKRDRDTPEAIEGLEQLEITLGHTFRDRDLIRTALTHASGAVGANYERLEFLGDRVLGLILASEYFHRCPEDDEGQLSLRLHALARQSSLVEIAREVNLAPLIKAQQGMDVSQNDSILSDVVESLIAALYLDAGIQVAQAFVLRHWSFETGPITSREKDAKSRLQEVMMEIGLSLPKYRLVDRSGPDHAPQMTYEVRVDGMPPVTAMGTNRKSAEQRAASEMLEKLIGSQWQENGKISQ